MRTADHGGPGGHGGHVGAKGNGALGWGGDAYGNGAPGWGEDDAGGAGARGGDRGTGAVGIRAGARNGGVAGVPAGDGSGGVVGTPAGREGFGGIGAWAGDEGAGGAGAWGAGDGPPVESGWTGEAGDDGGFPVDEEAQSDGPGPGAPRPAPVGGATPDVFLDGFARILADAAVTGRRLTRDEIESRRALGARAAQAGHGWRALVRAHLAASRAGRPAGADPDSVLAVVEQAVDAFADGYERAQRHVVRREEAARREFIDDLLHGRGDPGQLASRCERFGLRLSRTHAVAVAGGPEGYDESDPVPRQVADELFARFENRRILFTTKDGRMVCIAPGDQDDVLTWFGKLVHARVEGSQISVGRPRPGAVGIGHSYEEALNALDVAQRMGFDDPLLRAADLLVFPVLARDRQALVDLVRHTLGPLEHARGGAQPLLDTLTAYFDTGCVATAAARELSLSVRALTYRLARIHDLTGIDPADPGDRYTLQTAVLGARLLAWPGRPL